MDQLLHYVAQKKITSENIVQMEASAESSCIRESNMNDTVEDLDVIPYNSESDGELSDEPGAIEMHQSVRRSMRTTKGIAPVRFREESYMAGSYEQKEEESRNSGFGHSNEATGSNKTKKMYGDVRGSWHTLKRSVEKATCVQ